VALLTREYPPEVYGGAGVHVEYLARELRRLEDVTVHAWGTGDVHHHAWEALAGDEPSLAALRALSIDLTMAARTADADLVHSHTWYANLGGHLSKLVHGIPHVATVHSLEPLRPWVRDLELGREDRARGGRRGDRGVSGHMRRHPARVPGDRS
jgi:starch synthase